MSVEADYNPLCSVHKATRLLDSFHQLARDLNEFLALSPSKNFSDIDPNTIINRMREYKSRNSDWVRYAHKDEDLPFTRNLVDPGNGVHNLLILVWTPGKESPIHDHAGSHCIMKILHGSLKETRYEWPGSTNVCEGKVAPPEIKRESFLCRDDVTYITDSFGLHKMSNLSPSEYAVSLHLYAPPNAAKDGCHIFDAQTGEATHVNRYDLFSVMGILKERCNGGLRR